MIGLETLSLNDKQMKACNGDPWHYSYLLNRHQSSEETIRRVDDCNRVMSSGSDSILAIILVALRYTVHQ